MAEVVHEFSSTVHGPDRRDYSVRALGEQRGHMWVGWLEFRSEDVIRKTAEETSQPDRDAVAYWASGLEPIYLEGALARAR